MATRASQMFRKLFKYFVSRFQAPMFQISVIIFQMRLSLAGFSWKCTYHHTYRKRSNRVSFQKKANISNTETWITKHLISYLINKIRLNEWGQIIIVHHVRYNMQYVACCSVSTIHLVWFFAHGTLLVLSPYCPNISKSGNLSDDDVAV